MSDHHPIEYHPVPAQPGALQDAGGGYPPVGGRDWEEPEKPGGGFERYVAALLRFKWLILIVTFAGGAAGVVAAKMVPGQYQAEATLWVESARSNRGDGAQPIRTEELLDSYAWVELLKSYAVLDPVVRHQRLYISAAEPKAQSIIASLNARDEFRSGDYRLVVDSSGSQYALMTNDDEEIVLERGTVGDSVGRTIGVDWLPPQGSLQPDEVVQFSLYDTRSIAQSLAGRIQPRADKDVNFLTVSMVGPNPDKTAATVNAVVEQFVDVAADLKRSRLDELSAILGDQLRVAESNLNQAEVALQQFKVNTITLPADERGSPVAVGLQMTQDPVFSNFFDMKIEQEQLQRDQEVLSRVLSSVSAGRASFIALRSISTIGEAPALQSALSELAKYRADQRVLMQRYTERHARVDSLQQAIDELEQRTIPRLVQDLRTELATREEAIGARVTSASNELQQIPPRAIEEARLTRRVQIAERLYTTLQSRAEEARLAALSAIPDVRILSAATVPQWTTNGSAAVKVLLMFLVGAMGLGMGAAILLDRLDPKVRYPDQVSTDMGLPILGAVPLVEDAHISVNNAGGNHAIEAFREIRMNVVYAHGAGGGVAFTVTSAEAGDGKSFVASNLALAFAQQGHRTLLIDGDIRRGRLHRFLNGVRSPGLSDLLARTATLADVLQPTEVPNVTLIGSGTRMQVGPELLGSAATAQYLAELRRQFSVIIVDTPPLGAGVDPYLLAAQTGNMLMVVRTGNTNRAFAEAKLRLLDRLPVRILGAVLNGIPAGDRLYRYYSYLPDYGAREEVRASEQPASDTLTPTG